MLGVADLLLAFFFWNELRRAACEVCIISQKRIFFIEVRFLHTSKTFKLCKGVVCVTLSCIVCQIVDFREFNGLLLDGILLYLKRRFWLRRKN